MAPNTFHGYESGKHDPRSDLLDKIATECNVSVDYLLGRENIKDDDLSEVEQTSLSNKTINEQIELKYGKMTCEAFSMYVQLDSDDQGEIRGEMKHMLRSEKYSIEEELRNA